MPLFFNDKKKNNEINILYVYKVDSNIYWKLSLAKDELKHKCPTCPASTSQAKG